jgi:uncharacterized protein YyaL (SSP411 family)
MNSLSTQTSPYLKQHQHNPVQWYAWGEEAWQKAKKEDKLVLISIGYSACHWCHVMEKESFEDEATAAIMNEHFVCIKVDREERPDVDQVYMEAIQIINGSGGWPLNCFALPDGRPIHGGTYFRNEEWKKLLLGLAEFYQKNKKDALDYATRLTTGVRAQKFTSESTVEFSAEKIDSIILNWQNYFDMSEGGQDREPKFPLPNNLVFLLEFGVLRKNKFILNFLHLTLHKMAWGGIYDQVGGGFARYSVDRHWHVPHFEKMLYDNSQLVSLYSNAYQLTENIFYKTVIDETIGFVLRELSHPGGGFYSALDADSEGKEGKFYTWTNEEFTEAFSGAKFKTDRFVDYARLYFNLTPTGNWAEEETNILQCSSNSSDFCNTYKIKEEKFIEDITKAKQLLLAKRTSRVRPGLDDKILTSGNALMIKALADAYGATQQKLYLYEAEKHYTFLKESLLIDDTLYHTFHYSDSKAKINAFLDDYVFFADAAISLYQCTFKDGYLHDAQHLMEHIMKRFSDEDTGLFFYTGALNEELFVRKHEVHDNVIPASNSVMAMVLYKLGRYFENDKYTERSIKMLRLMQPKFAGYPSGYSQWMQLQLLDTFGLKTVCITGVKALEIKKEFDEQYIPNLIFAGANNSVIPIMQNKVSIDEKNIHICTDKACKPAVESIEEALKLME